MMYADFKYYSLDYHGNVIPQVSFETIMTQASAYLDYICHGNITEATDKVKNAACAVADVMYKQSFNDGVSSESVGNHSRSYVNKTESDKAYEKYQTAKVYLCGTGLLYGGLR